MSETSDSEFHSTRYIHSSGRLLPAASRRSSMDLDFNFFHQNDFDSLPSRYSKSVNFHLFISDKNHFKRFVLVLIMMILLVIGLVPLLHYLMHKNQSNGDSKDLTLALKQALLFFDAQKSGHLPENNPIGFRGDSGLNDGKEGNTSADLKGGFYDSGSNIKFSFSTAYTVTLLSWTVIEYHKKYEQIGEVDHIMDIIRWGSDYLLKVFIPPNKASYSTILYSQVGGCENGINQENDMSCWQRPEDMDYPRPISSCDDTAADLSGEIVAGMSAASIVLSGDSDYSMKLIHAAEALFNSTTKQDAMHKARVYTNSDGCGGQARGLYDSLGYIDELIWGGTWLFFATGNTTYLKYVTDNFARAEEEELPSEKGIFYWNNKLTANAILLTRIRYFIDLGYPYEDALSTNRTDLLMCSYLSKLPSNVTKGGLILLKPDSEAPLQYSATAAFLSKLYSDYIQLLGRTGGSCGNATFSIQTLQDFAMSQVNYILGDNPQKMSYLVGYGESYPTHIHHRGASIPWDGIRHSCSEGNAYMTSNDKNPNTLSGAMVGGPDNNDYFLDERDKPRFTEPSISSNAGLVAALVALHHPPISSTDSGDGDDLGIDKMGMFQNILLFQIVS